MLYGHKVHAHKVEKKYGGQIKQAKGRRKWQRVPPQRLFHFIIPRLMHTYKICKDERGDGHVCVKAK